MTDRDHPTVRIYNYDRYIIIHMTGLYTRLVTYTRLQILTWVVCLQLYYSSFIYRLIHVIVIQLSFIFNFRPIVILYTLFICTSTTPFLMHSLDHFLTTLDLHVQILDILFYWSGVHWNHMLCEGLEFSLYLFWYSFSILFMFLYFSWFHISDSLLDFISLFYLLSLC